MNCPKCGGALDDQARFCTFCGYQLEEQTVTEFAVDQPVLEPQPMPGAQLVGETALPEHAPKKKEMGQTVLGLIVGTVLILVGIVRILTAGTSIDTTSFGGDFYTYTYQGIVAISEILASIEVSLGWIIVAIGAGIDVSTLRKR